MERLPLKHVSQNQNTNWKYWCEKLIPLGTYIEWIAIEWALNSNEDGVLKKSCTSRDEGLKTDETSDLRCGVGDCIEPTHR